MMAAIADRSAPQSGEIGDMAYMKKGKLYRLTNKKTGQEIGTYKNGKFTISVDAASLAEAIQVTSKIQGQEFKPLHIREIKELLKEGRLEILTNALSNYSDAQKQKLLEDLDFEKLLDPAMRSKIEALEDYLQGKSNYLSVEEQTQSDAQPNQISMKKVMKLIRGSDFAELADMLQSRGAQEIADLRQQLNDEMAQTDDMDMIEKLDEALSVLNNCLEEVR